jgi:hypothetical protein
MHYEKLGTAYIMIPVPRTVFYTFVYPKLTEVHFWSGHYGDWAVPQFRTRLLGSMSTLRGLRKVFGTRFVQPKQQAGLSSYNTNPENGPITGYLLFFNTSKPFTFSVRSFPLFLFTFSIPHFH